MAEKSNEISKYPVVRTIEMRGETCPLPEIEAKFALKGMGSGEVLEMFFDDPLGAEFFPKFCKAKGYPFEMTEESSGGKTYWHLLILKL